MTVVAWMISHWAGAGGLHLVQPFVAAPGGRMHLSRARLVASSIESAKALLPRRGLETALHHTDFPDALETYVVQGAA